MAATDALTDWYSGFSAVINNLLYKGSVGNMDISWPRGVNSAVAGLTAPSFIRVWKAAKKAFISGRSKKSTLLTSEIPMAFKDKITPARLHLRISGTVAASSPSKVSWVNSLKHLPGATLPARPDRYVAELWETAVTTRLSTPVVFLKDLYFTSPESTTKRTPGMVIDVSAIFVDSTIFRTPIGVL